ncbi:hypothetical protein [Falsirhodobacter sp. alg1]|nr:hypothetical protein [Falsirhodobacter sp. alg1]
MGETDTLLGYLYFFGFWFVGIVCCAAAFFMLWVIFSALRQRRQEGRDGR